MRMRLFVAIVPPTEVLAHLELALDTARGPGAASGPLRWTEPGDRHLTLAFYGDVPDGYLAEVTGAMDELSGTTAPFRLALRGAGLFDGRTVWIGLAGDVDALQACMRGAGAVGTDVLGRDPDNRSRAHLTVARVRSRGRRNGRSNGRRNGRSNGRRRDAEPTDVEALAHALAVYEGPAWTVREIALVASDLGAGHRGAPRYDVVHLAALGAVAG
jgi:2'-5' RNA ligase